MSGALLPAARSPYGNDFTLPVPAPSFRGAETPVFDSLVAEFRRDFRTVPGDPWIDASMSSLGGSGRYSLPPAFGY